MKTRFSSSRGTGGVVGESSWWAEPRHGTTPKADREGGRFRQPERRRAAASGTQSLVSPPCCLPPRPAGRPRGAIGGGGCGPCEAARPGDVTRAAARRRGRPRYVRLRPPLPASAAPPPGLRERRQPPALRRRRRAVSGPQGPRPQGAPLPGRCLRFPGLPGGSEGRREAAAPAWGRSEVLGSGPGRSCGTPLAKSVFECGGPDSRGPELRGAEPGCAVQAQGDGHPAGRNGGLWRPR